MKKLEFILKKDQQYIPLNKLLQVLSIAQTGGHAKILVLNKEVKLNGEIELQIRKKLRNQDKVEVEGHVILILDKEKEVSKIKK